MLLAACAHTVMRGALLDDFFQSAVRTNYGHGASERSSECKGIGHEAS
jgi:hypothetical protein